MNGTYSVYLHTTPSGKKYVGITMNTPESRWKSGSGYRRNKHFYSAIRLYGWENIKHTVLSSGLTKEDAELAEIKCIKHWKTNNPKYGYNHSRGGSSPKGFHHTDEAKKKIGLASRNRIVSDETRAKLSSAQKGKAESDETRIMQSKMRKGNTSDKALRALELGRSERKPVFCYETETVYPSIRDASSMLKIDRANLTRHLNGKRKQVSGYHLIYA